MKKIALPLIIGVFLGVISVIIGKLPPAIALWSGMIMLGNHFGYLLGELAVAYFNSQKWSRSFWTSTLTIVIATIVYYLIIYIFSVFGIGYTESVADMLQGLAIGGVGYGYVECVARLPKIQRGVQVLLHT